jgi:hypothetical protein
VISNSPRHLQADAHIPDFFELERQLRPNHLMTAPAGANSLRHDLLLPEMLPALAGWQVMVAASFRNMVSADAWPKADICPQ